jgi:hypothetical protein
MNNANAEQLYFLGYKAEFRRKPTDISEKQITSVFLLGDGGDMFLRNDK